MSETSAEKKLAELKIILPEVLPAGNYLPAVRSGDLVFVSGQIAKAEGKVAFKGAVGAALDIAAGGRAARICMINALAALRHELKSLDKVRKIIKVNGYVCSAPGFTDQPKVMDPASDLLIEIFGEAGRHARATIGVVALPLGSAVELDLIAAI